MLVQDGNLLVLSTLPALADSIFATRAAGNGVLGTPEFKDWSSNIGAEANGFCYVSPAATAMFAELRDQYLEMFRALSPEAAAELSGIAKTCYNLPTGFSAYTVDKKGIVVKSNVQKYLPPPVPGKPE